MEYKPAEIVSSGHVVITGPIQGSVELADGKVVDVSPDVVEVQSQEEADEVAHLIGQRYSEEGHPAIPVDEDHPEGFQYDASAHPVNERGIPMTAAPQED